MPGVSLTLESDLMQKTLEPLAAKGFPLDPVGVIGITLLSGYDEILCGMCGLAGFIVILVVDELPFVPIVCKATKYWQLCTNINNYSIEELALYH